MRKIAGVLLLATLVGACASGGGASRREGIVPSGVQRPAFYTPAVRAGELIFFSGVIGTRQGGGGLAPGGIEGETRQALQNLERALDAADVRREDVVKCTVFLADIRDYDAMNGVYREFFRNDPPARSAVGVSGLPAGARVEIECIALAR